MNTEELNRGVFVYSRSISALILSFSVALLVAPKTYAQNMVCPDSTGDDSKPAIMTTVKGDRHVILCGFREPKAQDEFSEFNIYSVAKSGEVSKSIFVGDAFHRYHVVSIKNGLQITELISLGEKDQPAFETDVTCTADTCTPSREKCVYKKTASSKDKGPLTQIESYMTGKKKGQVPDESVIASVFTLALKGNAKAQSIFNHPPESLKLDAAPGEEFDQDRETLTRLKEAKCL